MSSFRPRSGEVVWKGVLLLWGQGQAPGFRPRSGEVVWKAAEFLEVDPEEEVSVPVQGKWFGKVEATKPVT